MTHNRYVPFAVPARWCPNMTTLAATMAGPVRLRSLGRAQAASGSVLAGASAGAYVGAPLEGGLFAPCGRTAGKAEGGARPTNERL